MPFAKATFLTTFIQNTRMNIKSFLSFIILFTIIYLVVVVVSAFSMWNFGPQSEGLYPSFIRFIIGYPLNPMWDTTGDSSLILIILNGVFWGCAVYGIYAGIKKLRSIKTT